MSNPYTPPNEKEASTAKTMTMSRFRAGVFVGAKWSFVVALPFSVWTFSTIYRVNTSPMTDHLTDARLPNPLTLTILVRCIAGAVCIPFLTIVLPLSVVCGTLRVFGNRPTGA